MGEYFWVTENTLPDGVGVTAYCAGHVIWLVCGFLAAAVCALVYRRLSVHGRRVFSVSLALVIAVSEVVKDTFLAVNGAFGVGYLPLHLCGLSIFACLADAFHPTELGRQLLYCLVLPGALAALLFPDWLRYPLCSFQSIHSFTIHILLITYPIMKLPCGELRPDWKKLPRCFLLLVCVAAPVYVFNKVFGTNFMFLNWPSAGSPLELFAQWLGNPGYLLGLAALFPLVWSVMYLPWIISDAVKRKKRPLSEPS